MRRVGHRARVRIALTVQRVHLQNAHPPWSKTFDRAPVIIGRDDTAANCPLPDPLVSRVHASIDLRDDAIWVRDAGSRNGTLVAGQPIPSDRWFAAAPTRGHFEIRIGHWVLSVQGHEAQGASAGGAGGEFLTQYAAEPGKGGFGTFVSEGAILPVAGPSAVGESHRATVIHPPLRVGRAYAHFTQARKDLLDALVQELDTLPPNERPHLIAEILRMCPGMEVEPATRGLLERQGRHPLPHSLESGSAVALQELARWYVPDIPPLATAQDAFAFARKMKSSIDELLAGLVPLFAGLDSFEDQMALRPGPRSPGQPTSSRLPRVPRDAARRLFDWRDTSDHAVRAVRTDLIDLTMHQVAMLNGVMQGVNVLLTELAPDTIDKAWERRQSERGALGRFFAGMRSTQGKWAVYRQRHGDLADEENERFRVIFGPEFAAEYKQSGEAHRPLEVPRLPDDARPVLDVARARLPLAARPSAPPPAPYTPAPQPHPLHAAPPQGRPHPHANAGHPQQQPAQPSMDRTQHIDPRYRPRS